MSPTPNKRTRGLGPKGVDSDICYDFFFLIVQFGENEIGDNWVQKRLGFFLSFFFFEWGLGLKPHVSENLPRGMQT